MIRRRLTLKRVDPWSVLKFGFVVNIALLLVAMLGFWILWIVIGRLGLVEQFCDSVGSIVLDLQECSLNGGNIFRTLLFLGLLGVVVQTGIMVFGAFLYNLISDLTGGLGFTFLDESGDATATSARKAAGATAPSSSNAGASAPRDTGARAGVGASTSGGGNSAPRSAGGSSGPGGPPDQSSTPRRPTPDGPPPGPAPHQPGTTSPGTSGSSSPDPQRSAPSQSGSLWGDPTRSNDRS